MADVGRPAPEVYRLSMAKLPLAVGRAQRFEVLRVFAVATVVTALLTALTSTPSEALDVALVMGAVAILALPYALWRAGRLVRRHWNAFELAVGSGTVRAVAKGEGRVTIPHGDIASISEGVAGLDVRSIQPGVVVRIPRTVEAYADVRARLAAVRPIAVRPEAVAWCGAVVGGGVLAALAMVLPRVPGGVALGLMLCQWAGVVVVAGELRGSPLLAPGTKTVGVGVALGSALLPIAGLFLR